ncbi:hypothetical protein D3867_14185 [Azospirillum argentinense]|nr:hypothetical protein D3867_14185 [Azospirillum argentinense]
MAPQTNIRPPCDCIEDEAPCHHGPRYVLDAQAGTTAPLNEDAAAKAELIAQLDRSGILQAAAHQRAIDDIVQAHGGDMRRLAARVAELEAETRITRRDAADAVERAQRAEARNVILLGKDTYDLPAVLDRANRLQRELDEMKSEADPRNWPGVIDRLRRKAAAANKGREVADARATQLREALEKCAKAFEQPLTGPEEAALNAARAALSPVPSAGGA